MTTKNKPPEKKIEFEIESDLKIKGVPGFFFDPKRSMMTTAMIIISFVPNPNIK